MIDKFLDDKDATEAFIIGPAGSGKTTDIIKVCETLSKRKITYRVVAYTHKAKEVLISKLPKDADVSTLHSWLKKRPGVNSQATHLRALVTSSQYGAPEPLEILIVDEFSFVGEKDYYSIGELQDENILEEAITLHRCIQCHKPICEHEEKCSHCGLIDAEEEYIPEDAIRPKPLKVLYVGDLNQLSPIDGPPAVVPHGDYIKELTEIHRVSDPSLQAPIDQVKEMIESGSGLSKIEATDSLLRNIDIVKHYKENEDPDKIMLAWTNAAVQTLNAQVAGKEMPSNGDRILIQSLRKEITVVEIYSVPQPKTTHVTPGGNIDDETKYNPLKFLKRDYEHILYVQAEEDSRIYPLVFGYNLNKNYRKAFGEALVNKNKAGKSSGNEYRLYKNLNDYVSVADFPYCQTIHKSQGQEFSHVYIDIIDVSKNKNVDDMLKLLYVAMSRSRVKIYFNK